MIIYQPSTSSSSYFLLTFPANEDKSLLLLRHHEYRWCNGKWRFYTWEKIIISKLVSFQERHQCDEAIRFECFQNRSALGIRRVLPAAVVPMGNDLEQDASAVGLGHGESMGNGTRHDDFLSAMGILEKKMSITATIDWNMVKVFSTRAYSFHSSQSP